MVSGDIVLLGVIWRILQRVLCPEQLQLIRDIINKKSWGLHERCFICPSFFECKGIKVPKKLTIYDRLKFPLPFCMDCMKIVHRAEKTGRTQQLFDQGKMSNPFINRDENLHKLIYNEPAMCQNDLIQKRGHNPSFYDEEIGAHPPSQRTHFFEDCYQQ